MARTLRSIRRTIRAAATTSRHLLNAAVSGTFRLLTRLYTAIDTRATLRIAYTDSKGVPSVRAITPRELWISRAGDINLRAWDWRDGDTANFRTDRVQIA